MEIDDVQAVATEERGEFERLRTELLRAMENEEGERTRPNPLRTLWTSG